MAQKDYPSKESRENNGTDSSPKITSVIAEAWSRIAPRLGASGPHVEGGNYLAATDNSDGLQLVWARIHSEGIDKRVEILVRNEHKPGFDETFQSLKKLLAQHLTVVSSIDDLFTEDLTALLYICLRPERVECFLRELETAKAEHEAAIEVFLAECLDEFEEIQLRQPKILVDEQLAKKRQHV